MASLVKLIVSGPTGIGGRPVFACGTDSPIETRVPKAVLRRRKAMVIFSLVGLSLLLMRRGLRWSINDAWQLQSAVAGLREKRGQTVVG